MPSRPILQRHLPGRHPDRGGVLSSASGGEEDVDRALTDCAVYDRHGHRCGGRVPLVEAVRRARDEGGFAWVGLHDPSAAAVERLGELLSLHPLAVEDAIEAHQRPKLEIHDDVLHLVLKTVRYDDEREHVEIGELQVLKAPHLVATVRHGDGSSLKAVRTELEAEPERMAHGPATVLHAVVDRVVDEYAVVVDGLSVDVDQVEADVFSDERSNPTERIYRIKREVIATKRAVTPLLTPMRRLVEDELAAGGDDERPARVPEDLRTYLRDVLDHLQRDADGIVALDELLSGVLDANLAQLSVRQNDDNRKISAWAAIGLVPTAIFGLYGMNFERMPELKWTFGYPAVLLVTAAICTMLHWRFRRSGWL